LGALTTGGVVVGGGSGETSGVAFLCIATSSSYVTCTGPWAIQGCVDAKGVFVHDDEDDAPVALAYVMNGGVALFVGFGGISLGIAEIGGGAAGAGVPAFAGVP